MPSTSIESPGKPAALSASTSGKKTVYVIAEAGDWKYGYNKRGLLVKAENPASIPCKITYSYDKKMRPTRFKSVSRSPYARESSGTFAYDKKGRLAEIMSNGSHSSNSYRIALEYNRKGLPSTERIYWTSYNGMATSKNSFDKKGRLAKKKDEASGSASRFSYDSKGNLKKAGAVTFANAYESGRLALRNATAYKYKRISVPKKCVPQVKRQQWALLNPEAAFVFPPYF